MKIDEHYSESVLITAERLLKQDRVEEIDDRKYSVRGSGGTYTVRILEPGLDEDGEQLDDGMETATCTCANGRALGGRPKCKHTAAVLILRERQDKEAEEALYG